MSDHYQPCTTVREYATTNSIADFPALLKLVVPETFVFFFSCFRRKRVCCFQQKTRRLMLFFSLTYTLRQSFFFFAVEKSSRIDLKQENEQTDKKVRLKTKKTTLRGNFVET